VVAHASNPSYTGGRGRRITGKSVKPPSENQTESKGTKSVAQVTEHLPGKRKALSSIPIIDEKKAKTGDHVTIVLSLCTLKLLFQVRTSSGAEKNDSSPGLLFLLVSPHLLTAGP
jgi:hypothetical protein